MTVTNFPLLPLVCLHTADFKDTYQVVDGKPAIIDFWTTRCTRCPAALDKLDRMASDARYEHVKFISICCDGLDGARHIIEKDDDVRWPNVNHYFMTQSDKEKAKQVLGFKSVPFCVVVDKNGTIVQMGEPQTVEFDDIPGMHQLHIVPPPIVEDDKKEDDQGIGTVFELDFSNHPLKEPPPIERVFILDHEYFWSDSSMSQMSEESQTVEFDDIVPPPIVEDDKKEEDQGIGTVFELDFSNHPLKEPPPIERVFLLDDDF